MPTATVAKSGMPSPVKSADGDEGTLASHTSTGAWKAPFTIAQEQFPGIPVKSEARRILVAIAEVRHHQVQLAVPIEVRRRDSLWIRARCSGWLSLPNVPSPPLFR